MIIDFHTHIFPDNIAKKTLEHLSGKSKTRYFSDGTQSSLIENSKRAGVNYSVTLPVATNIQQVEKINTSLISTIDDLTDVGIIPFGAMHPDYENPKAELKRLKACGIKGIKVHPTYQNVDLGDLRFIRIISAASELDMIVLTHAGFDIGYPDINLCSIASILKVIKEASPTKLVLAHMGGWGDWGNVKKYLCGAPAYFDASFSMGDINWKDPKVTYPNISANLSLEQFSELSSAHGTDKILFGTDSPWSSIEDSLSFIRSIPGLAENDKTNILGETAKILLNL